MQFEVLKIRQIQSSSSRLEKEEISNIEEIMSKSPTTEFQNGNILNTCWLNKKYLG